jgi:Bacterial Ig-like domain
MCNFGQSSYVDFTLNISKSTYSPETHLFRVPILRDSLKIALAVDISENMGETFDDETTTKMEVLKEKVYELVSKLEEFQQEGDSLGLSYFTSDVVQPEAANFPNDFIRLSDETETTSLLSIYTDLDSRTPQQLSALGEGLLDAKLKLDKSNPTTVKKIIFLFSDGKQNYGNKLKLNGLSFENTEDSLNNYSTNPNDSIIYITISTTKSSDVPPIMAAIAHQNNGMSINVDENTTDFQLEIENQLDEILDDRKAYETASRICGLYPYNDSIDIQIDTDMTIEFNEDVAANSGNIIIYQASDDSEFETVDVLSGKVSGNNTSTITINPTNEFERGIEYYVLIDENAFKGTSGNNFAGITSKNYWTFTSDNTFPTVTHIIDLNSPEFDAPVICGTNPTDSKCVITLPPIELETPYTFLMPITSGLNRLSTSFDVSAVYFQCSEAESSSSLTISENGEINAYVEYFCNFMSDPDIEFNVTVEYPDSLPETFKVKIPIERSPLKVAFVVDLSENMSENLDDGVTNKLDVLKESVSKTINILEENQQEGDSLCITYFNTNTIDPDIANFDKDFIRISNIDETVNTSYDRVLADITPRTASGNAALGEAILDAKNKLFKDNSTDIKRVIFIFSDGFQDFGNLVNLDGQSFSGSLDSLNNIATSSYDSINYFTFSITEEADVLPIMSSIAHHNEGISFNGKDNSSWSYLSYMALPEIFMGNTPEPCFYSRIYGLNPYDDSLYISVDTDLTLEFNEDVAANTGNIVIYSAYDDSEFETIDVLSGKISGNNTSTITINPANEFESEIEYYILIDENAFEGTSGNNFVGITSKTYWSFTAEDTESPTVALSTENSTVTESQFDIDITFSEEVVGLEQTDITVNNGTVQSLNTTDNIVFTSIIEAISEGDVKILIDGNVTEDDAGNTNEASEQLTVTYENTTGIENINAKEVKIYSSKGSVIVELVNFELNTLQNAYAEVYSLNGSLISKKEINQNYNKLNINNDIKYGIVKVVIDGKLYSNEVLINQ